MNSDKIAADALALYKLDVDPSLRCQGHFLDAVKTSVEANAVKCEVPKCRKRATHHFCPEHNLKRAEAMASLGAVRERIKRKRKTK